MKKILLGSIVLTFFSISVILFQISCQKGYTINAQTNGYTLPAATTSTLGGVIVGNGLSITSNGTLSVTTTGSGGGLTQLNKLIFKKNLVTPGSSVVSEIWIANYDGTGAAKVNISLPTGIGFSDNLNPVMSPNGQKIFFTAGPISTSQIVASGDLYSCNVDGSSVTKILDKGGANNDIILGAAN
ncbi:MAG: hypothetical protein HYU71_12465 [Bacteroidetes bacterium]|nr:hypothetical protein [Bacteroidota bacterium]